MPKQSKRNQKKSTTKGITDRFKNLRWHYRLFAFAGVFAAISGGYLIYQSFASDLIPKGSSDLVLSYEIGGELAMARDDFPAINNPAALLYGNGLLLCSDQEARDAVSTTKDNEWRFLQLNRGQVQRLVSTVRGAGFDKAAGHEHAKDGVIAPESAGRFIKINTTQGATEAAYYPGDGDAAFLKVENVLKAKCAEATQPYVPEEVIVETVTLVDPASAANAEELPANIESTPDTETTKQKSFLGAEAKEVKQKVGKEPKVCKKDGKAVKARTITKIPEYNEPDPAKEDNRGKVSAAPAHKTRWVVVLAKYQDRPAWATSDMIQNTASSVRSWYKREVGETFTVDGLYVVRGDKTRDQYKTCTAAAKARGCSSQAEAIYYNMAAEYAKPGYSTNIIVAFEPTGSTLGMGSIGSLTNASFTDYIGTTAVTFAGTGNDRPLVTRQVAGHEIGHNFGLSHRVCGSVNLMASCLSSVRWPDTQLFSEQALQLRRYSTFFE